MAAKVEVWIESRRHCSYLSLFLLMMPALCSASTGGGLVIYIASRAASA